MENVRGTANKLKMLLPVVLIATLVFLVFLPTLNNGFVWDDKYNFVDNTNYRGLSPAHLKWMFTTFHDENYHPLLWLTYGFDFVLWGMSPAGYHLTNLVLHGLNAILFYFLIFAFLRRTAGAANAGSLGVPISAVIGAFFFAVHPLRVETVSVISIRGDVLCGFFYLLTIIAYLRMSDAESVVGRRKWFLLSLLFFVFSLLSKAWGITMPLVLLILDVYPLRRFDFADRSISSAKKLLIEKIPFAMLALLAGILALLAKKPSMLKVTQYDMVDRFMQATYGLYFYVWKTVMPIRLSPLYLLDKNFNPMEPKYILGALLVLGITTGLIIMRHRWPWALTTWVCYAVIVSPLLGFVQSGPQIAADRYTYISSMPFGVLVGAGMLEFQRAWRKSKLSSTVFISGVTVTLLSLVVLASLSFRHVQVYRNNFTFWTRAIQVNPEHYVAFNNRGVFFKEQEKDYTRALADYNTSIELYPNNPGAYYNRGLLREELKDFAGAIEDYTNVILLDPEDAKAYNNRGGLLKEQGKLIAAMADFNTAIQLNSLSPQAYANRGVIRQTLNDLKGACSDFTKALEVAPADWPFKSQVKRLLIDADTKLQKQLKHAVLKDKKTN